MAFRAHWRVVESVRRLILVQEAVGSSPTSPAIGASASGLSQQFLVLLFVGSNPTAPSNFIRPMVECLRSIGVDTCISVSQTT